MQRWLRKARSGSRKPGNEFDKNPTMNTKSDTQSDPLQQLFKDGKRLNYLAKEAVRDALREHKRLGQSVVIWQDGKVVTVAPEDIPVDLTDEAA